MIQYLDQLLQWFGILGVGGVIAFAAIKYFAKNIFESYLQKSIENYKSDLERAAYIHQVQFSSLHKERAELIRLLYYSLFDFKTGIRSFFNPNKQRKREVLLKEFHDWIDALDKFSDESEKNRIYFPQEI